MRKIAIVAAFAALAWAQGVRAEDPQKAQAEAQEKAQKAEAKAQQETREAKAEAQEKTAEAQKEAREEKAEASQKAHEATREQMGTGSGAAMGTAEKKHPMFEGKDNFEVKGRIESVSASSITVSREELPAAKLSVDKNTKIELDGKAVSASQLKQGQEVKASFNLKDDKPMAVEIKAEKKMESK